jgi:hypothetical protein
MEAKTFVSRSAAAGGIGVLCVVVGGVGIATAANGGSLTLGGSNTATHTTTLTDTSNSPLSLITKKGKPPLSVNSKGLVKNLNAGELGGLTTSQLSAGSGAQLKINLFGHSPKVIELPQPTGTSPALGLFPEAIVSTAKLAKGTYEVTGTVLAEETICWLGTTSALGSQQYSISTDEGASAAETATFRVKKGQRVREWCAGLDQSAGDPGGTVISAGLTAVRVASSANGTVHPTNTTAPLFRKSAKLLK